MPDQPSKRLRYQLPLFVLARMVLTTGYRMMYPFAPAFARGLGVSFEAVTLAITARSGLGLFGPLFGSLGDRHGRKRAMLAALALFSIGLALTSVWPTYSIFFLAVLGVLVAKMILDASVQAYLGDHVPYERRGTAIAITELGWSLAFLAGIPLVGWLIDRAGWNAPFPWLAAVGAGTAILLWRLLPTDAPANPKRGTLAAGLRQVMTHPAAVAMLAANLSTSLGNELVNIVFGAWMENTFGLRVAALGAASAVIGIAELSGEGLVAGFADRIGKRRAVAIGITLNALACLALPLVGRSLAGALVGLFLLYITFEMMVVSTLPLLTELVPGARATLMSVNLSAMSGGRMLGALAGPLLFRGGMHVNGIAGAAVDLLALALLLSFVHSE